MDELFAWPLSGAWTQLVVRVVFQSEVDVSDLQYGGIKGTGVNNFLARMWDEILNGLEEQKTAITLMSVDFSKAFNRMQHQACLKSLARRGASNQSILP